MLLNLKNLGINSLNLIVPVNSFFFRVLRFAAIKGSKLEIFHGTSGHWKYSCFNIWRPLVLLKLSLSLERFSLVEGVCLSRHFTRDQKFEGKQGVEWGMEIKAKHN